MKRGFLSRPMGFGFGGDYRRGGAQLFMMKFISCFKQNTIAKCVFSEIHSSDVFSTTPLGPVIDLDINLN